MSALSICVHTALILQAIVTVGFTKEKETKKTTHRVIVKTGDKKGAGVNGNIFLTMIDTDHSTSDELLLDVRWRDDFQQGQTDKFSFELPDLGKIKELHIHRDETDGNSSWFVEKISVQSDVTKEMSIFPLTRWIHANSTFFVSEFDSFLPQSDPFPEQRAKQLEEAKKSYELETIVEGLPKRVANFPEDESFSNDYQWDIVTTQQNLLLQTTYVNLTTEEFESLEDFQQVYNGRLLTVPDGFYNWKKDAEFGNQRLSGINPGSLKLCKEIPDHFAVTAEMVEPFLEGQSLRKALKRKKVYIVDLTYLADIEIPEGRTLPGPTGLFYSHSNGDLLPIAIQLMPTPSCDNPVFLPSDPEYTWLAAKMWFNLADASEHQSSAHLGLTHLLMETVAVITHRQLAKSHPVFKLLAPHFIYLIAINELAITSLVNEGGSVDKSMSISHTGLFNIVKYNFARWDLHKNGNIPESFRLKGVDDKQALPNYPYRDDSLLLWNALEKYVTTIVNGIYDCPEKLIDDYEIQAWAKELSSNDINGVPVTLRTNKQLIEILTVFIFTSSAQHAAVNFGQYDEYAFPPNYPSWLNGEPPKDKAALTEEYIVQSLPTKEITLEVLTVTKLLSQRGTNGLGTFEVQYAYDPVSQKALNELKSDLVTIGQINDLRNSRRKRKYVYLHPEEVPNAISI